jgi:HlyD family secretion protein
MNTSLKHKIRRFFSKWWVITGIILIVIIALFVFSRRSAGPVIESASVTKGDVIEKVSVTGKVSPVDKAELSFQKSGVITNIKVKVGDHVNKGDMLASLDSAGDYAALKSAQAQLADLTRGLRPEEFATDQSVVMIASTTLANAQKSALNAARDGYVKAQSAVVNYADQFFYNAQSVNPTINVRVDSESSQIEINKSRLKTSEALSKWKNDIDTTTVTNASALLTKSEDYLATIKNFMSDLSIIINDLSSSNSGLSQATINAYVTAMNTGLSTMTQALVSVTSAETTLKSAQSGFSQANNQFSLQKAGSSAETIAAQSAKVEQARAEYNKDFMIAPISGVITKVVPNTGEFVAGGSSSFAIQSDGAFKIEARVPEADIAKVAVGNGAAVTLDAYGPEEEFPATVVTIDPAETVLEGVATYKVTLQFNEPDSRIRSGMTANTDITTHESKDVLLVPSRAIVDDKGVKTVRVLHEDGKTYGSVTVVTGLKGSDGTTEIKSGLSEGEKVVTYVK